MTIVPTSMLPRGCRRSFCLGLNVSWTMPPSSRGSLRFLRKLPIRTNSLSRDLVTANRDIIRVRVAPGGDNAPILCAAARSFRDREPQPDVCLVGLVQRLKRDEWETDGAITLRAYVDGRIQSVTTVLKQSDYEQAIHAHTTKAPVVLKGELERFGQRWRLLNPSLADVILNEDTLNDGE